MLQLIFVALMLLLLLIPAVRPDEHGMAKQKQAKHPEGGAKYGVQGSLFR